MVKGLTVNYGHVFEEELLKEINEVGTLRNFQEGEKLMEIGQYIKYMPLLVSGVIKVLREDNDGNELLLYFLQDGDTCAMTMTCCLGRKKSEVRVVAESVTEVLMIPIGKMEDWLASYKSWRNFVLNTYHTRLNELLDTVDSIAFLKMDERLLKYLKDKVRVLKDKTINSTHQEIAYDLNTSRVVVSRLLKKLEIMGKVKLHRNHIEIISL
ncbi:Crp/Fnr family transcriptional regulator [Maribacter aestuarii]|uniref:Crp/Fnr family transcriptional regulator n=1 Tax=Maribacter aestuarii TaxID=1130723 RepID=UPI0025A64FD7|nr:Crp/Fnr family transcriptional regulator [Maribacter aestuarii]